MPCIILIGFMASGKTAVGRRLAEKLDVPWVDLDHDIEALGGCSISELFARKGELGFRRLESDCLVRALALGDDVVISGGGGLFIDERNRELITKAGAMSIYLDLPFEVLALRARRKPGKRPLFDDEEAARRVYEKRLPIYAGATLRFELDGDHSADQVADQVRSQLEARCAISC